MTIAELNLKPDDPIEARHWDYMTGTYTPWQSGRVIWVWPAGLVKVSFDDGSGDRHYLTANGTEWLRRREIAALLDS